MCRCGATHRTFYDRKVRRVRDLSCGEARVYLELEIRRIFCRKCGAVKQERLPWLADNPFYTKGAGDLIPSISIAECPFNCYSSLQGTGR